MKLLEWTNYKFTKKVIIAVACTTVLTSPLLINVTSKYSNQSYYIVNAATNESTISLKGEQIISSGVIRKDYVFKTTRSNKQVSTAFHVMEIDLSNPYISLQAISASGGEVVGKRATVKNMATQSGAIAAINGDVFAMKNEGAPLGTQIRSQVLQVSPSLLKGMYAFGITADKKPVIDSYTFEGNVVVDNSGSTFKLSGINQSTYASDISGEAYSHANKLFIYTSAWGGAERPANSATTPTEVLVVDGLVKEIPTSGVVSSEIPQNGYVLRGHGKAADFLKQLHVGDKITADYNLVSQTTKQKISPSHFEMMVSGHTLLLDNGQATSFSRDISGVSGNSYTSRTAVGYSANGKTVYLVTAEKSGSNTGVNLKELQTILKRLGAYKAVNLDGGGSTTMVERKLGYTDIVLSHATQESSLRAVANGIGVFTNAPQGQLKGIFVQGAEKIFIGQSTAYQYGAYDTYYNPMTTNVHFSDSQGLGSFTNSSFTALKSGKTDIVASSGNIKASQSLQVIGGKDLTSLLSSSSGALSKGAAVDVSLVATLSEGDSYKLDGKYLSWEFIGFNGSFNDGKIVVDDVNSSAQYGYAIGKYDGFTTMIPFLGGETVSVLEDFNHVTYGITNQVLPEDTTKGGVKLVAGASGNTNDKALSISYDFSQGTGTKASYASFNGSGLALSSKAKALTLDVYGDNGNHWLRAELVDAKGNLHYVDLAKNINWSGWKTITAPISTSEDSLKLRRIYVITLDSTKEGLAQSGEIMIDNMKQTAVSGQKSEKKEIKLYIGKNDAVVNGQATKLDVSPQVQKGTTYLPLRFVTEQLGAQLQYDEKNKMVTVLLQGRMMQMKLGDQYYNLNGKLQKSEVAPFASNNRTLIPVRLFSEKLGYNVHYDAETQSVTIY